MSQEKATLFVAKILHGVRVPSGEGNTGTKEEKEREGIIIYRKTLFFFFPLKKANLKSIVKSE